MDSEPVLNSPANSVPWHSHTLGFLGSSHKTHLRDGGEPGSAGDTLAHRLPKGLSQSCTAWDHRNSHWRIQGVGSAGCHWRLSLTPLTLMSPDLNCPYITTAEKKKKKPSWPQTSYVAEDVLILFALIFRGQGLIIGHSTKLMQYSGVKSTN